VAVEEPPSVLLGEALNRAASLVREAPRGALVCGPNAGPVAAPAAALARAAGWPLLAEPTSGARCGAHDRSHVVAHYDVLLRAPRWAAAHRPELIVRVGDTPTSKPLRSWLAQTRQLVLDPHAAWHEPTRAAEEVLVADAALACAALAEAIEAPEHDDRTWLESWLEADAAVAPALAAVPDPFEPKTYTALAETLQPGATVWVSSSMPIRDVESFFPSVATPLELLSNRGANGIDGIVSSALGAAAATGGHAYLLTGELALLHDLGALLTRRRLGLELTIVCVNNRGGGIFDFLPLAQHAETGVYEELVATPSGADLAALARALGVPHAVAETPQEVYAAAAAPGLVEVRTDRSLNVAHHRELFARVASDLDARVG
jgi:2-succinyl-5-enolpyruvyl-6-hydroxy-3-cyclohexene-1-carboxylate synthase